MLRLPPGAAFGANSKEVKAKIVEYLEALENGWHSLYFCEKCGLEICKKTAFLTNEGSLVCDLCADKDGKSE